MKPVIVVAAYNRGKSIKRLLTSLEAANYEEFYGQIKLFAFGYFRITCISI